MDARSEGVVSVVQKPQTIYIQPIEPAETGSGTGSPLPGSQKETEMIESYVDMAEELNGVFRRLVQERPIVVKWFLDAFAERSQYRELPESLGLTTGMQRVLSYLLRGLPHDEQLTAYDQLSTDDRIEDMDGDIAKFEAHITPVLKALARDNAITLSRYKTNIHNFAISREKYVGALLLYYVHCKSMYPY